MDRRKKKLDEKSEKGRADMEGKERKAQDLWNSTSDQ